MFGLAGPHITSLGKIDKRIPLGVMGLINLVGSITVSFLPETVGCDLPETLKSASDFGKDQQFFSYVRSSNLQNKPNDAEEHLMSNVNDNSHDKLTSNARSVIWFKFTISKVLRSKHVLETIQQKLQLNN